jgi:hypothetical protein
VCGFTRIPVVIVAGYCGVEGSVERIEVLQVRCQAPIIAVILICMAPVDWGGVSRPVCMGIVPVLKRGEGVTKWLVYIGCVIHQVLCMSSTIFCTSQMVFSLVCTADFGLQPIGEMLQAVLKVPDAVLEVHDNRHLHVVLVPLCLTLHVLLTDATRQSLG